MIATLPTTIDLDDFAGGDADLHAMDDEIYTGCHAHGAWGLASAIDLGGCNPQAIRDRLHIERFVLALCNTIAMRRFGDPIIVRFGDDPRVSGYSLAQLIETSLISGHFAEQSNAAYIDIFSCKPYRPCQATRFCAAWFGAGSARVSILLRPAASGAPVARTP